MKMQIFKIITNNYKKNNIYKNHNQLVIKIINHNFNNNKMKNKIKVNLINYAKMFHNNKIIVI